MSLAEFDPLSSPASGSQSAGKSNGFSPASAAQAKQSKSTAPSKQKKPFEGVTVDFLIDSIWHSLGSTPSRALMLSFHPAKPRVAAHEKMDLVERLQREKQEREEREREEKEKREAEEKARQERARAAAAKGKEEDLLSENAGNVLLPSPQHPSGSSTSSTNAHGGGTGSNATCGPVPLDPALAKAHEDHLRDSQREEAERNRHADRPTVKFVIHEDEKENDYMHIDSTTGEPAVNCTEFIGAFRLSPGEADKTNIIIEDIVKSVSIKGGTVKKSEVGGSSILSVTSDGKRISGKLAEMEVEFELFESSNIDPDQQLQMLLGY